MVRDELNKRAALFNLMLDDVSITHVAFSPEFTLAVEAKQVAQQTALQAAFLVDRAVQEKEVCVLSLSHLLSLPTQTSLFAVHHCQSSGRSQKCWVDWRVITQKQRLPWTSSFGSCPRNCYNSVAITKQSHARLRELTSQWWAFAIKI